MITLRTLNKASSVKGWSTKLFFTFCSSLSNSLLFFFTLLSPSLCLLSWTPYFLWLSFQAASCFSTNLFNKHTGGVSVSAQPSSSWVTLEKSLTTITLLHLQGKSKMLPIALTVRVIQRWVYLKGLLIRRPCTLIQWFNKHILSTCLCWALFWDKRDNTKPLGSWEKLSIALSRNKGSLRMSLPPNTPKCS